jgi:hypothetical protein
MHHLIQDPFNEATCLEAATRIRDLLIVEWK